jgi:dihydroxy-acid dehydratase
VREKIRDDEVVADAEVIRSLNNPLARHPGIVILRGSLAPDGAVVKRTVADDAVRRFSGPAKVFHSREAALAGIRTGQVEPGQVVVLSGLGLRGAPGMGLTSAVVFALDGARLGERVAVVTDGQMSGLVNKGLTVAEVSPEGAVGGPLGLVRDGDTIRVDVDARTIDLDVPAEVLARRRASLPALAPLAGCGWLAVYARSVRPLREGATLGH